MGPAAFSLAGKGAVALSSDGGDTGEDKGETGSEGGAGPKSDLELWAWTWVRETGLFLGGPSSIYEGTRHGWLKTSHGIQKARSQEGNLDHAWRAKPTMTRDSPAPRWSQKAGKSNHGKPQHGTLSQVPRF